MRNNFSTIVTIDADLQHDPDYIPALLKLMEYFDIVIGSRMNDMKDMPLQRRLSNTITSYLLSKKTGVKIIDSQSGFRAYKAEVLSTVNTTMNGFEAESEILLKAVKKKFNVGFIDIPTIYADEKSKMKPMKAIKGFIRVMLS